MENINSNTDSTKPLLTIIIEQYGLKQEFSIDEDMFNSFDEACEALKKFIQSNRS